MYNVHYAYLQVERGRRANSAKICYLRSQSVDLLLKKTGWLSSQAGSDLDIYKLYTWMCYIFKLYTYM